MRLVYVFVFLLVSFTLIAQEDPFEVKKEQLAEEERGKVMFESVLKDADYHVFEREYCWTLKFENGAILRIQIKPVISWSREIFWVGRRYQVIVSDSITSFEVREMKDKED